MHLIAKEILDICGDNIVDEAHLPLNVYLSSQQGSQYTKQYLSRTFNFNSAD